MQSARTGATWHHIFRAWPDGGVPLRYFFIFWLTMALHIVWGLAVVFSPEAVGSTPIDGIYRLFDRNRWATAEVLLGASACGILGLWLNRRCVVGFILMSLQQVTLVVSAGASATAIITGTYGDGIMRSPWFICTDQSPIILLALLHTFGMIWYFGGGPWKIGRSPSSG